MKHKISIRKIDTKTIRAAYNNKDFCWYYAIIDLIGAFIDTPNSRRYWNDIKRRNKDVSGLYLQFKLTASDGKKYNTDVITKMI